MNVLVFNPGSATLKFGLFQVPAAGTRRAALDGALLLESGNVASTSPADAVEQIIGRLAAAKIDATGCRVVHGGALLVAPTRVTDAVLGQLRDIEDLAPLHVPADIAVLDRIRRSLPDAPLIAVFDTAFHQTLPDVARTYALPVDVSVKYGLRRYGFHGISHASVSAQLIEHLGRGPVDTRIIVCHLGSGASVCAVRDGNSIDTSMGLTPMEGLVMGTRSGDIDPGLVLYLLRSTGMTVAEVDHLLNQDSGLRGLSGLSSDLRDIEQAALAGDRRAELALGVFAYRVTKYIGAFAAALGGLDAVAFTGGIGEHSAEMRRRICGPLEFLGLRMDEERNRAGSGGTATQISGGGSPVEIWMIPTEEEREIAVSTYESTIAIGRGSQRPRTVSAR